MAFVCVDGIFVPAPLAAAFLHNRQNKPFRTDPFSYSHPNPGGPKLHQNIHVPKVLPLTPADEMSSQAVHLQYNSPMGLYNKETANEQFQQQIGANSPMPMGASDKSFDPNKSATLRYLKEGDHSNFGANFAEKIAAAEAPNVPYSQEPHWARYAREKSERARSRTPADPHQNRYSGGSRSPSQPRREHHDTPWEHAEKTKTYTNAVHPNAQGPAYWQYQHQGHRHRGHSAGSNYPDRGYECGGMDYTKGLPIEKGSSGYYEHHVSRKDNFRPRPGYEMGGSDFGKGFIISGPYHGHGPDPPRLRPRYHADPHSTCNSYVSQNVDGVDANLLVGDTLSNQKIRHEVRHIDQSEFGTSFAPPGGFKRDHLVVKHTSPPAEPVTFSTNCASNFAKRSSSAPRVSSHQTTTWTSSAPIEQQNVWRQRQAESEKEVTVERLLTGEATARRPINPTIPYWSHSALRKHENWRHRSDPRLDRPEVYTSEPNWSQTVQQRKGAWERKAFDTDRHVNLPASAKVPVQAPPAWHQTAQQKHQVWQSAADHMQGGGHHEYQTSNYLANNAMNVANSGFNQNQMDYLANHQNNYQAGQQYSPRQHNTSYSTTTTSHFPGGFKEESYRSERSQSETRSAPSLPTTTHEEYSSSKFSRRSEETVEQISPGIKAGTFLPESQPLLKEESSHFKSEEGRVHPIQVAPQTHQESHRSSSQETRSTVIPAQTEFQEQRSHFKSSSSTREERTIPVQTGYQESSQFHRSSNTQETRTIPVQPVQNYQESYHKTTSSTQETTAPLQPIQTNFQENYQKSSSFQENRSTTQPRYETGGLLQTQGNVSNLQKEMLHSPGSYKSFHSSHYSKQETTTSSTGPDRNVAPQVTTTTPVVKNTSYSYSSQSVSNPPQPTQIQQNSTTNTTSRETAIPVGYAPLRSEGGSNYHAESHHSYKREEQESRPVSQLSQYSQSSYNRKREERTETRTTVPTVAPLTHSSAAQNQAGAQTAYSKIEMSETLPRGTIANTHSNTQGGYRDQEGHDVFYKKDLQTTADPGRDVSLLKEEEKRVVETPLEPGVISRHVTTKYYKKKTVTDTTTTTTPETR